ncbi:hypothetical protein IQ254_12125 [Nodosilinea sp. LEGE 07088]|uniref:hypothetical protein n=1 Tax=Nodosilinea sp. LEGE 07088 TaxID=2777968 RepID=UPI0018821F41|nr:hypothetical protein [Nodosilinea sp. LEGE 07088]MBE9137930.1 hypothetical protein [Nodosilinea sp. LEGE 07088]
MNHYKPLSFLLAAQAIGILFFFPYYAFFLQDHIGLRLFSIGLASLAVLSFWSVVTGKPWALWLVLTVTSLKLTLDLFAWATFLDRSLLQIVGQGINISIIVIAFRSQMPSHSRLSHLHKLYYGFVLGLALPIGIWGLLMPEEITTVLPFMVPPLHARFLGSMYLSGATFMGLNILAKQWSEARVVTPMIAIWTGMLGLISLFYLEAFNWELEPTWIWFVAYIGYPLIAAWITWQQRSQTEHPPGSDLSRLLRIYLLVQSSLFTLLALCLLFAPAAMVKVWPWAITPLLAHIYSAPFLSFPMGWVAFMP